MGIAKYCPVLNFLVLEGNLFTQFHHCNITGAPVILQSYNRTKFTVLVITELKIMWPELKLVHGKLHHSKSQASVAHANRDIQDMLKCSCLECLRM